MSIQRISDTVVEFHLDRRGERWAVWQRIRGNRSIFQIVTKGVTFNTGRPYNRLGDNDVLRLTDVSSQTEISEL